MMDGESETERERERERQRERERERRERDSQKRSDTREPRACDQAGTRREGGGGEREREAFWTIKK